MNIKGSSFWLSNHLLNYYDVAMSKHCVRSAGDPILQNMLQLWRKIDGLEDDEIDKVTNHMLSNCVHVTDWNDFPENAVNIVPKREDREELINRRAEGIKNNSSIVKHVASSYDEYQYGHT